MSHVIDHFIQIILEFGAGFSTKNFWLSRARTGVIVSGSRGLLYQNRAGRSGLFSLKSGVTVKNVP